MFTVSTYRGIVNGWRIVTVTDDKAKAERMLSLASRIFSAYPNRLACPSVLTPLSPSPVPPSPVPPKRATRRVAPMLSPLVAVVAGWLLGGAVVVGVAQSPYIRCASSYVAPECK